jgi:hypothetical protein
MGPVVYSIHTDSYPVPWSVLLTWNAMSQAPTEMKWPEKMRAAVRDLQSHRMTLASAPEDRTWELS